MMRNNFNGKIKYEEIISKEAGFVIKEMRKYLFENTNVILEIERRNKNDLPNLHE